jgi:hypothetical protein
VDRTNDDPLAGERANPTSMLRYYRRGYDGFVRPGPPPAPPLPLKFTCGGCGRTAHPDWVRCPDCGEAFPIHDT